MPDWLTRQLRRAFRKKDRRQICILNDCWYLYQKTYQSEHSKKNEPIEN
ncbi:cortex morphogenetic protein CmpA [Caldalkalibacillus mannanilyticus]|nr:cortex morphogenetic protein CmpA [Caldalkalibacillus mannanilyticus]